MPVPAGSASGSQLRVHRNTRLRSEPGGRQNVEKSIDQSRRHKSRSKKKASTTLTASDAVQQQNIVNVAKLYYLFTIALRGPIFPEADEKRSIAEDAFLLACVDEEITSTSFPFSLCYFT